MQDETFANARHQLDVLLEEEAAVQDAQAKEQPLIPPPVPNSPPVPPPPQSQPQPQQPAVDEFEDAQADKNPPGNDGDGIGNQDAEPEYHIINIAGNQIRIRDAHVPKTQFQGTKTWSEGQ